MDDSTISQYYLKIQYILPHCTIPATYSFIVCVCVCVCVCIYLTALVPEALVAAIPHNEASAPGSVGDKMADTSSVCVCVCVLTHGEPESCVSEVLVQCHSGHSWSHRRIEIISRHLDNTVHLTQLNTHTSLYDIVHHQCYVWTSMLLIINTHFDGSNTSFQSRSGSKWDQWNVVGVAEAGNGGHVIQGLREDDNVGRERRVVGLILTVLLPHGT